MTYSDWIEGDAFPRIDIGCLWLLAIVNSLTKTVCSDSHVE
jgi:hypothetical protein